MLMAADGKESKNETGIASRSMLGRVVEGEKKVGCSREKSLGSVTLRWRWTRASGGSDAKAVTNVVARMLGATSRSQATVR
jgi:hypothetical protein